MATWQQFAMSTVPTPAPEPDSDDDDPTVYRGHKGQLAFHGNERTMNINPLILTNVQGSPYFKVELFGKKTFHEVVDEIYYKVDHLEPWACGSRKTAGRSQTGMCGGVRGVSAGGIVSSAYCLLYKLYTLKLTKKQVMMLLNHCDSPYIRGLGFMYLRYYRLFEGYNTWNPGLFHQSISYSVIYSTLGKLSGYICYEMNIYHCPFFLALLYPVFLNL